jgi:hypothetical protein
MAAGETAGPSTSLVIPTGASLRSPRISHNNADLLPTRPGVIHANGSYPEHPGLKRETWAIDLIFAAATERSAGHYSVRRAVRGSTLAARAAGTALAANATKATPINARR